MTARTRTIISAPIHVPVALLGLLALWVEDCCAQVLDPLTDWINRGEGPSPVRPRRRIAR